VQDELLADIEVGLAKAEQRLSGHLPYGVLRAGVARMIADFESSYQEVKARSTDHEVKLAALAMWMRNGRTCRVSCANNALSETDLATFGQRVKSCARPSGSPRGAFTRRGGAVH